ncbi:TetR/AcrR family transcriptional regulator [Paenibacillus sp. WLX2291]|uniref:TetR/AcrR family transcriptional regulator n=1 Tax=Paenibacillus sp. WLX2291 TaxID=3296934 RepID=UPI0039845527
MKFIHPTSRTANHLNTASRIASSNITMPAIGSSLTTDFAGECMEGKRTDRRVLRTREAILQALLQLAYEKPLHAITVMDITRAADINRATFYAHYQDKQDLLDSCMDEILVELDEVMERPQTRQPEQPFDLELLAGVFREMFEHIWRHADFYKVMLGNEHTFTKRFQQLLESFINKGLQLLQGEQPERLVKQDVYMSYNIYAHLGVIYNWLEQDLHYSPCFMAEQFMLLYKLGGARVAEYEF